MISYSILNIVFFLLYPIYMLQYTYSSIVIIRIYTCITVVVVVVIVCTVLDGFY